MPVVSESGCSGGGRECIPAGRDESMQRERGGEREREPTNVISLQSSSWFISTVSTGDKHPKVLF